MRSGDEGARPDPTSVGAGSPGRIEQLLRRPSEVAFRRHHQDGVFGRSVLITGAAGFIGAGLARQVAAGNAEQLTLLDTDESRLFELVAELEAARGAATPRLEAVVGSITSRHRLWHVFAQHRPNVVIHAAAYKHVPLMEAHPEEAVETNVLGTLNVCLAAEQAGSDRLVFLSTDKAVAPTSVMGATKRIGERLIRELAGRSTTIVCVVRLGNVLWSRGSVAPSFERQIRQGGPVTITHPEMERFFMTLPDAVDLLVEAASLARSGETFVLDMGEPIRIADLATAMIRLYGKRPGEAIEIREIGPRPGERLREALTGVGERLEQTAHPRVSRVVPTNGLRSDRSELLRAIERLGQLAAVGSRQELLAELFALADPRSVPLSSCPGPNGRDPGAGEQQLADVGGISFHL